MLNISIRRTMEFDTHTPSTTDISETTESCFLVAICNVIRLGFRRHLVLFNLSRRHGYLILRFRILFHVTSRTRHEPVNIETLYRIEESF